MANTSLSECCFSRVAQNEMALDHVSDAMLMSELFQALSIVLPSPSHEFPSIQQLMMADHQGLEAYGLGSRDLWKIRLVRSACLRMRFAEMRDMPVLSTWWKLLEYLQVRFEGQAIESAWMLMLDKRNRLMAEKLLGQGTIDHCPVYPREIVKAALLANCGAVILCHNHPSGDPTPSRSDIEMTRSVQAALASVDISLHDHVIIGKGGAHTSFKTAGLL